MGGYIFTLRSDGGNAQSISLAAGKNIDVSGTADVVIGSSVANERLSIDLGMSAHAFSVAAGRTLTVLNTINGSGAMSKQGTGALKLATPNALPTTTTLSLAGTTLLDLLASQMVTGFSDSVGSLITIESGQEFAVTLGDAVAGTTFEGAIEGLGAFRVGANNGDGQVVTLTQDNTFMGGTTIDAGGALQLGNGGSTGLVAGNVVDYGRLVFDHPSPIMYGAVISGTGRLQQGLAGSSGVAGDLRLTGANTYSGGTETYDGAVIAASASGSATGGGPVTVHAGAMLLGKGTITSPVVVKPGGMLGAAVDATAPSSFTVGATTLYSGGEFGFVIRDANGVAGTDLSLLHISGALTLSATTADPFVISLYSASGSSFGPAANFDSTQAYTWKLVTTTGGICGFNAAAFQFNTTKFQNAFGGGFDVTNVGNDLFVNYSPTAVP